jgi:hypothetical protein
VKQKIHSLLSEHVRIGVNKVEHLHQLQSLLKGLAILIGGRFVETLNSKLVLYKALHKVVNA